MLAGAVGHEDHWTGGLPRPLLPLPGGTVVEALLARLSDALAGGRAVCANGHTEWIAGSLARCAAPQIQFYEDRLPRGTAGCLRDCAQRLTADCFLVIGGAVWLEDDPMWIVQEHRRQGNALTVCCAASDDLPPLGELRMLRPAGVYCCDRVVLEHIRTAGYQDLKEQTVPALRRAGLRVGALRLRENTTEIRNWQAYLRVIARCLDTGNFRTQEYERLAPGIWSGRDVVIAPTARIAGPVFLGHGCRLEAGAVVVGPAVLGARCRIGPEAWVIRSTVQDDAEVGAGMRLDGRVQQAPSKSVASRPDCGLRATGRGDHSGDSALGGAYRGPLAHF